MSTAVTVLGGACTAAPVAQESTIPDSLSLHITSSVPFSSADIFAFADTPEGGRIFHSGSGSSPFVRIPAPREDIICVGIANAGGEFADDAFPQFSGIESTMAELRSEDPLRPVMSGFCQVSPSDTVAELELSALLCSIVVDGIEGGSGTALTDPAIWLENLNPRCNILRYNGFYPSEMLDGPYMLMHPEMVMQGLPFNIGTGLRETGIQLCCYPNESRVNPTQICLGGYRKNVFAEYKADLPPLGRSAEISIRLRLDGDRLNYTISP